MDDNALRMLEDLNRATADEVVTREHCCSVLANRFASVQPNVLAWSEETFTAQRLYPGLSRAAIAKRWVDLAEKGKLVVRFDPARGLQISEA